MTQGYSLIAEKLKSSYQISFENYYKAATDYGITIFIVKISFDPLLDCLEEIYQSEHRALQRRMSSAKEYLTSCEECEKNLQARYASLRSEYENLIKKGIA